MRLSITIDCTSSDPEDQAAALSTVLHSLACRAFNDGPGSLTEHRLPPTAATVSVHVDDRPAAPRVATGGKLF